MDSVELTYDMDPERNGVCRHCNGQWKGVTSE